MPQTFVGNHDVTRIATLVGHERVAAALAVLFTIGGIPSIYYGDEQGFTGTKFERLGGDDEVRPMFPENPDHLSPLGEPVFRLHQDLVGLRRRNPWLVHARTEKLELRNEVYRYAVHGPAGERLEVTLDLAGNSVRIQGGNGETLLVSPAS